jgi:hypothetical protein
MASKLGKRPATPEEEEKALLDNAGYWNRSNPSYAKSIETWREMLAEAKKDGYSTEVCECGVVYLAFHHFVTCRKKDCPFSDGVTLWERMDQAAKTDTGKKE